MKPRANHIYFLTILENPVQKSRTLKQQTFLKLRYLGNAEKLNNTFNSVKNKIGKSRFGFSLLI